MWHPLVVKTSHSCKITHCSGCVGLKTCAHASFSWSHNSLLLILILHHLVPVYLQSIFMFSENVTGYVSRNSYHLLIPRMQSTYRHKSLFYRGVVSWNNIDQTLYLATCLRYRYTKIILVILAVCFIH